MGLLDKFRPAKPVVVAPVPQALLTLDDYWMGRAGDSRYVREWTFQIQENAGELITRANRLLAVYGKTPKIVSGWRPTAINIAVKGAKNSAHVTGEAMDLADPLGDLKNWIQYHANELERAGLYMEAAHATPTWCHLQTRPTKSGRRIFNP